MTKETLAFTELKALSTTTQTLHSILHLLQWDQETYMPEGSIQSRSEQIALLSTMIHEKKTSVQFKRSLEKLVSLASGNPKIKGCSREQQAMLKGWRREYMRETKLPTSFVKNFSQLTCEASQIWAVARKENNFKLFAPFLQKIITMSRQKTEIFGFQDHPYDALLESYEPAMTTHRVETIFSGLKKELVKLLQKIQNAKAIDNHFLHTNVNEATQVNISKALLAKLPMEKEFTRLDISSHPFSIAMHPQDSRITTRILPHSFMSNIFSILHESGHSMYELGLPNKYFGTPLCQASSLTVHESQSRFWETIIGRGLPFWQDFFPTLKTLLPKELKQVKLDHFYRAINTVAPSLIRVEADEVTYCLHVILRFEIEKQLIQGTLQVADLPYAWNAQMKELFGITPPTDTQGCLQDIHWSLGDFGYFPTYALGNILAAHIFTAFKKQYPDWQERIARGDLDFVRGWLKTNIHQWGKMYDSDQLAKRIAGKPLTETAYCNYLKEKYLEIYRIK
ncbi:MAG TPA: carboxypeptidase M32 [Chlamydiales bacterium]|nr:carboxypeptidase M32 [Chlamydiales bacterium]